MPVQYQLSALDYTVLGAFGLAVIAITLRCAQKANTTESYFLASRSSPGWVVGLSFIGTSVSSLSFLAFPAAAYQGNWGGVVPFLIMPVVAIVADQVCLPLYRRLGITSGYEYLEQRFGPVARIYGSTMFLLLQVGRVGLILVLVSLPLTLLTGLSQEQTIVLCGLFTTLYVLFGGLSAVLWTDVLQTILLGAGAVFCTGMILFELPGGLSTVLEIGRQDGKFSLPPWHVSGGNLLTDLSQLTLLVLLLHGIFNQLLYYSADQNVIQRYLAVGSQREARKGLWIGSLGVVPLFLFFTFLGTCLYVYYLKVPDAAVSQLSADEVFPHFILTQLPPGVVGLIVAALLAAAMSSLDSNLNAIALVFQVDIYRRLLIRNRPDEHYLRAAKVITLVFGALITFGALVLASMPTKTLLDLMFLVYAVFAGGLAGLFLLGMLTLRTSATGVTAGIVASVLVSVYLTLSHFECLVPPEWRSPLHPYLIGAVSNTALLVVGYGTSLISNRHQASDVPDGLTVWSSPSSQEIVENETS